MTYTQGVGRPTLPTQIFGASGIVLSFYVAEDGFGVKLLRAFLALLQTLFARSFALIAISPNHKKTHDPQTA